MVQSSGNLAYSSRLCFLSDCVSRDIDKDQARATNTFNVCLGVPLTQRFIDHQTKGENENYKQTFHNNLIMYLKFTKISTKVPFHKYR